MVKVFFQLRTAIVPPRFSIEYGRVSGQSWTSRDFRSYRRFTNRFNSDVESAAGHSNATRPFSQHNYRTLASRGETERWKRNAGEGSKRTQLREPRLVGLWDFKFSETAVTRPLAAQGPAT